LIRYGLKKYHLKKHKVQVQKFLVKVLGSTYKSDIATKYQQRIAKYQEKMFTFLDHDGVPWNNNNAEHAVKYFAKLRKGIDKLSTPVGVQQYCVLLSICETLRLRNVSVLKFLMSGSLDIDNFTEC
jgi:hypothetical protein